MRGHPPLWFSATIAALSAACIGAATATFTVATYNLESYLDRANPNRPPKTTESKAKIREGIRMLNPDVIALQEIGGTNALLELRDCLKQDGLDFPDWELVYGSDTNINVAILSRFPFVARRPHTRYPPSPRSVWASVVRRQPGACTSARAS